VNLLPLPLRYYNKNIFAFKIIKGKGAKPPILLASVDFFESLSNWKKIASHHINCLYILCYVRPLLCAYSILNLVKITSEVPLV